MSNHKLCASLLLLLTCLACPVFGHGLNIFAWLENGHILVQCDFGRDRAAVNATITVYDSVDKKEIDQGKTNTEGRYSFVVPDVVRHGHGLTIIADAGQGHRGEWSMDASELRAATSLAEGFDQASAQAGRTHSSSIPATANMQSDNGALTREEISNIVQEALELKLGPIRQELAAHSASGPSLAEIIGGIGWIIGLAGVGFYFKARKN